jgi:signal transduction histidine kinase
MCFVAKAAAVLVYVCATAYPADRAVVGWNRPPSPGDPAQGQQAIGFTAEVIREAATRAGIGLEWRETRDAAEVDAALDRGWIDIAPAAVSTPERRARFFLSDPWWNEDLALIVRGDGPQIEAALAGKRIALKNTLLAETARQAFPESILVPPQQPGTAYPTTLVCRGEADAALMTHRDADMMIGLHRPPECADARLSTLNSTATLGLVVMSRPAQAETARRLRRQIDELIKDGTLARIAARHPGIPASSAAAMAERMREHGQQQALWIVVYALLGTILVGALTLWRMHVIIQSRERAERALKHNEEVLRRSNEDLQAYAYTVSHDLQEPLRMVTAYVDLLVRKHGGHLNEEAHGFLAVARSGAVRMSSMLQDLLAYGRSGQEGVEPALVDVEYAVKEALATLEGRVAEAGARVMIGPLPVIRGWQDGLVQVFQNLVENSLKYRRPDVTPQIEIQATRAGEMWQFSVSDNGIGFDREYSDKVFRVFQRLHGRGEYSGNGIGLAIAKRVVERHGGRIWVDWSEPGKGVRFCFSLPASG